MFLDPDCNGIPPPPRVGKIVMRYTSALASLANSGNRGSFIRSRDWPYHLDSNSVTPSPPVFVLIGKHESSATAEAVAHKSAETKRMEFIRLAHHDIDVRSVPKVRMLTEIYHNSMVVPD